MALSNNAGRAEQSWFAERYNKHTPFVGQLGAPLLNMLVPRPGEWDLKLSYGDGEFLRG